MLQEEQRQLQAKRKNKQALLDELVRSLLYFYICALSSNAKSHIMTDVPSQTHKHTHTLTLRVHGCEIIKSLLPVFVLWAALFSFCDSKAFWLHCVELQALEVIVPAEQAAEGPSQIAG